MVDTEWFGRVNGTTDNVYLQDIQQLEPTGNSINQ